MRQPIYVNARFVTQELTGVQRFAQEISLELKRQLDSVVFLSPPNVIQKDLADALEIQVVGSRTGHAWEQVDLPKFLRSAGNPLLINLMSTAPLAYSNQIATLHDINFVRFPQSYSRKFLLFYRVLVPLFLRRIRFLITVSEFSKREISDYYRFPKEKILVVQNAVNKELRSNAPATDSQKYILAVSSTNHHKNFARLIEAFGAVQSGRNDISLFVVGKANASFRGGLDALKDAEGVKFLGRVSDERLAELYAGALAFAFPSLYEGFGIPPLEAQLNGCPVVSSNAAAMPEVLGDSALYFDPTDVEDIGRALLKIVADPDLREKLVEKGRQNVAHYSWPDSASRLVTALRDMELGQAITPNATL